MKKTLEVLAWFTLSIAGLAWFWPQIKEWLGFYTRSGVAHLAISVTFMLINLTINGALFWLYGGRRAIHRFREARKKNNV